MKYLLVIGDGMADDPIPELDGKTPIEYVKTPAMDAISSAGVIGEVLTVPEDMPAGSDPAILSIFGYDPKQYLSGRAPLEAAAMDIPLKPGDIAFRCNVVTFEDGDMPFSEKKILSHSAGSIEGDISDKLIEVLMSNPEFAKMLQDIGMKIYPGNTFRHIAVCGQGGEFFKDLITFPPHDHIGESLGQYLPQNVEQLVKIMKLAFDILDKHPINLKLRDEGKMPGNGIWFWAEGNAVELPAFYEKYQKTGAVISAVPLCHGIGVMIGLKKVTVEGATGELYTNYEGKVAAAMEALETLDFATVHIEAPDECSHNGILEDKLLAIEWVDSRVVAPLVSKLRDKKIDFRMMVISDHRTLLATRGHDGGPVPYAIYDSRFDNKTGIAFSESTAAENKDNYLSDGTKLMGMLFSND